MDITTLVMNQWLLYLLKTVCFIMVLIDPQNDWFSVKPLVRSLYKRDTTRMVGRLFGSITAHTSLM